MRAFGFSRVLNEVVATNSTATPLAAAGTFTGGWYDAVDFDSVTLAVLTDADGTMIAEFSPDGTNADSSLTFNVHASVNCVHRITITRRFFRVRYVNGSTPQSYMRLQVMTGEKMLLSSPLNATVRQDADATVVRNVDAEILIAEGKYSGYDIVNKFGRNPSVSMASEDIWGGDGLYAGFPNSALETLSIVSSSTADDVGGTGAEIIRVTGLDGDYNVQSENINLDGQSPVTSANTYRRVHTAQIIQAGSGGVNAGTITINHSTTTANVFLIMAVGLNQTNNSAYTVPAGKTAYLRRITSQIFGTTTASVNCGVWTRAFGRPFRQRRPFGVTNAYPWQDEIYGGLVFTEKSDIILRIQTAAGNNTVVTGGYDLILVDNA